MKVVMTRSRINKWQDSTEILQKEVLFAGSKQECQDWIENKKKDLAVIVPLVERGGYFLMDSYSLGIIVAIADGWHSELSTTYFIEE